MVKSTEISMLTDLEAGVYPGPWKVKAALWFPHGELAAALLEAGEPFAGSPEDLLMELASFAGVGEVFPVTFTVPRQVLPTHPALAPLVLVRSEPRGQVLALAPQVRSRLAARLGRLGEPVDQGGLSPRRGSEVTVPAPRYDFWAHKLLPQDFSHPGFSFHCRPTRVGFLSDSSPDPILGWRACYSPSDPKPLFLTRLVPKKGSALPSEGWQNILFHVLRQGGFGGVPLKEPPRLEVLAKLPYWEFRVEAASSGSPPASWDVQFFPSRRLLASWAGQDADPGENTAYLRLFKGPGPVDLLPGEKLEADEVFSVFLASLEARDLKTVVQNFLLPLAGAGGLARLLCYKEERIIQGRAVVKVLSSPHLPEVQVEALLKKRLRREWDQARRHGRVEDRPTWSENQKELGSRLENQLRAQDLVLSPRALDLWDQLYRRPFDDAQRSELEELVQTSPWNTLLASDPRIGEDLLRSMDVTDAALCLRAVPDGRWRKLVSARREKELLQEMDFLDILEGRGELTLDRILDGWRQFHGLWAEKLNQWG